MVMPVGRSLVFSGSQAKNISYPTDHRQKIFRTLPIKGLPITLASPLSPLNVPKTGFPWSIPPDLARLTPSDRYPELDDNNFSPCLGTFDPKDQGVFGTFKGERDDAKVMGNPSKNSYRKSDSISYMVCDLPPGGRDQ